MRQIELSQTAGEIQHSKQSIITPVMLQRECNLRILFEQNIQSQELTKEIPRPKLADKKSFNQDQKKP